MSASGRLHPKHVRIVSSSASSASSVVRALAGYVFIARTLADDQNAGLAFLDPDRALTGFAAPFFRQVDPVPSQERLHPFEFTR